MLTPPLSLCPRPQAGSDFSPSRSLSSVDDESFGAAGAGAGAGAGAEEVFDGSGEQEGFICPSCMRGFATPEKLQVDWREGTKAENVGMKSSSKKGPPPFQVHYESEHGAEASLTTAKRSEGKFADLKGEVSEMQSVLREEQLYSTELKREVERLSEAVKAKNGATATAEQQEREMYREQVAMLEEGKRLREWKREFSVGGGGGAFSVLITHFLCSDERGASAEAAVGGLAADGQGEGEAVGEDGSAVGGERRAEGDRRRDGRSQVCHGGKDQGDGGGDQANVCVECCVCVASLHNISFVPIDPIAGTPWTTPRC